MAEKQTPTAEKRGSLSKARTLPGPRFSTSSPSGASEGITDIGIPTPKSSPGGREKGGMVMSPTRRGQGTGMHHTGAVSERAKESVGNNPYLRLRKKTRGPFAWWTTLQPSPTQPTARISPLTWLLRVVFLAVLFACLQTTLPIQKIAASRLGLNEFTQRISVDGVDGHNGNLDSVGTLDDVALYSQRLVAALFPQYAYGHAPALLAEHSRVRHHHRTTGRAHTEVTAREFLKRSRVANASAANSSSTNASAAASAGSTSADASAASVNASTPGVNTSVGAVVSEDGKNVARDSPYLLRVHRLLNSVVISQRRVRPTSCSYENVEHLYPACYEALSPANEMTSGFHGYKYDDDVGGFFVELPLNRSAALTGVHHLVDQRFWDSATREASIRFAFINSPGHFSGYCTVHFDISPFGVISHDVEASFLRLQPYSSKVAGGPYSLIILQAAVSLIAFFMTAEVVVGWRAQRHIRWKLAYILRPWGIADIMILYMFTRVITSWCAYMWGPARHAFSPDQPEFAGIALLAKEFQVVLFWTAMLLLLSTIRTLEYMVLVDELASMYEAMSRAVTNIGWFGFVFMVLFLGFVLSGHILFGSEVAMFSTLHSTVANMMLWLLTLGGGHEDLFEERGGLIFLALFLFVCLLLVFNILMALVFMAFEDTQDPDVPLTKADRPFNHVAADWIADKCGIPPYDDIFSRGGLRWSPRRPADEESESEESIALLAERSPPVQEKVP